MGGTNKNAHTGKVNNPWDVRRISGGSSGGSAVLVAEMESYLLRLVQIQETVYGKPAAYNGVIGVKPTIWKNFSLWYHSICKQP